MAYKTKIASLKIKQIFFLILAVIFISCEDSPIKPDPLKTETFTITSMENFMAQYAEINSAADMPNTQVIINISPIGIDAEHIDFLCDQIDDWGQKPNVQLNWTSIYPNTDNILLIYAQWEILLFPPLSINPETHAKWMVLPTELQLFVDAGYGDMVAEQPEQEKILVYNIPDVENFFQQFQTIDARSDTLTNQVIVNMASMGFSAQQRDRLASDIDSLRSKENVQINHTDYFASHEDIEYSFSNHYVPKGMPPLRANPHFLIVSLEDFPLFQNAGQSGAVKLADIEPETHNYNITTTQNFLDQLNAIVGVANQPNTQVNVIFSPITVAETQLNPLTDGVYNLRQMPNVVVNWTGATVAPATTGILYSFDNHYERKGSPNLAANPDRWSVTESDLPRFQAAGQGHAVEVPINIVDYPIANTAAFLNQLAAIINSANQPNTLVNVIFSPITVAETQLNPLTDGVYDLRQLPNVTVNWTNGTVAPAAARIFYDYNNHYVRKGSPNLAATPHKWRVTEADLPLFQNAGQGAAVEVIIDGQTFTYNIANPGQLAQEIATIRANLNNHPDNNVIVNMASMGFTAAERDSLATRVGWMHNHPRATVNQTNYYAAAAGIDYSFDNHYEIKGRPTLIANPHRLVVSQADFQRFVNAGQNGAIESTFNYAIANTQAFLNELNAILVAANLPNVNVNVNFAPITVAANQLNPLTDGVYNLRQIPGTNVNWDGATVAPTAAGIDYGFDQHFVRKGSPNLAATPDKWTVTDADLPRFQAAGQGHAVEVPPPPPLTKIYYSCPTYGLNGERLLTVAFADTVVWNRHLADATNLDWAIQNWTPGNIVFIIETDPTLPGGVKALGNATGITTKALHTPSVQTGGRLRADRDALVTSFSPMNAFILTTAICGSPAAPIRIDELGDEGDTNWAFSHLFWSRQLAMSTIGQSVAPHVQSTRPDGRIYFEPGRHFVDPEDPIRFRYSYEWFWNRVPSLLFGVRNNVTIVIEMGKLTLTSSFSEFDPPITGNTPEEQAQSVYNLMSERMGPNINIELPTLQQVKASLNNLDSRGP